MPGTDTFCTLWKITPRAGVAIRVCNFEADLTYQAEVYTALPLEPTEVLMASGLSPDNAEITVPLIEPFTVTKLLGGYWRGARVEVKVIDWSNLAASPESEHAGYLGEVTLDNLRLTPQYRSLAQAMNQAVGDLYSETCRYLLGDAGCKKDLTAFTFTGTVTAVTDNQQFTVSVVQADGYFHKGKITFTSGDNNGLSEEIINNDDGALILFRPMVGTVAIGNAVTLIAGDDKTLATCRDKFANAINFGGEPHLSGRNRLFHYPG